ncbi:hypothetical protein M758_10G080500 [Ceratodon purpureus]|uniref:Uncharacterized protein n=1 Tax=Ceratodon purpureus TaxID=3225 RepID=A0A8T0GJF0_CERPU|nr:hypothetical protein KC19_10G081800 [Ceratodon purpureus]KAG0603266.1 hypothetical protein M758_10G080500 [Ceratodon purpureus]
MGASLVPLERKLDNAPGSLRHASQFFVNREISSFKVGPPTLPSPVMVLW